MHEGKHVCNAILPYYVKVRVVVMMMGLREGFVQLKLFLSRSTLEQKNSISGMKCHYYDKLQESRQCMSYNSTKI